MRVMFGRTRYLRTILKLSCYCVLYVFEFIPGLAQIPAHIDTTLPWASTSLMLNCALESVFLGVPIAPLLDPNRDSPVTFYPGRLSVQTPIRSDGMPSISKLDPLRDGPTMSCPSCPSVESPTVIAIGRNIVQICNDYQPLPVPRIPVLSLAYPVLPLMSITQSDICPGLGATCSAFPHPFPLSLTTNGGRIIIVAGGFVVHNIMSFFSQNHPT